MTRNYLFVLCAVIVTATNSCQPGTIETRQPNPTLAPQNTIDSAERKTAIVPDARFDESTLTPAAKTTDEPAITSDVEFDPSTANHVVPEDVLTEIAYFGGGGGVRCVGNEQSPTISYEPLDGELMTLSTMIVCGWQEGEVLQGTIRYPDGTVTAQEVMVEVEQGVPHALLSFKPGIADPPGTYTYILEGKAGSVEANATFRKPSGPRLFRLDDNHIFLYGFEPKESVRLFYYRKLGIFDSWKTYQVDSNGQLTIKTSMDTDPFSIYLFAIGNESGEARLLLEDYWGRSVDWVQLKSIQKQNCGNLKSRLSIGKLARVAFTDGADMRIRKYPGLAAEVQDKVPEGTSFIITEGPKCYDDIIWWKIRTADRIEGWMAEFADGVYLLEFNQ